MKAGARASFVLPLLAALPLACSLDSKGTGMTGSGGGGMTATSSTASGGAGGEAGAGGQGGAPPRCGDGHISAAEECDDGNEVAGDGCTVCVVDCGCPDGCVDAVEWKDGTSHHCYRLTHEPIAIWSDARASCTAWGGDLAALSTVAEIAVVGPELPAASEAVWIGGNDQAIEGTFLWSNGEPWGYSATNPPWFPDQPNDGGAGEDCVAISSSEGGRLADGACTNPFQYLCERTPAGQ